MDRGHASHCSVNIVCSLVAVYQCTLVLKLITVHQTKPEQFENTTVRFTYAFMQPSRHALLDALTPLLPLHVAQEQTLLFMHDRKYPPPI